MKHYIGYLIAALILVLLLNFLASPFGTKEYEGPVNNQQNSGAEQDNYISMADIGVVLGNADSSNWIVFRNCLKSLISDINGAKIHFCENANNLDERVNYFKNLLRDGCNVIFVKLDDSDEVQTFLDASKGSNSSIIFLGEKPSYDSIKDGNYYYLGSSAGNSFSEMAYAFKNAWESKRSEIEWFEDDVLSYAVLSNEDFENSGKIKEIDNCFISNGIKSECVYNTVTQKYGFSYYTEIDKIWYAKAELLICTNAADVRLAYEYLSDPSEFSYKRIGLVALTVDDETRKLIENNDIWLAIGSDMSNLGKTAAMMAECLANGVKINNDNIYADVYYDKMVYVPYEILKSDILLDNHESMNQESFDLE